MRDPEVELLLDDFEKRISVAGTKAKENDHSVAVDLHYLKHQLNQICGNHEIALWWKQDMEQEISRICNAYLIPPTKINIPFQLPKSKTFSDNKISQYATPSGASNWVYDLFPNQVNDKVLYPKLVYRDKFDCPQPKSLGETFVFNKENRCIELKNATPELIEDLNDLKWRKDDEIQNRIANEGDIAATNLAWFCG